MCDVHEVNMEGEESPARVEGMSWVSAKVDFQLKISPAAQADRAYCIHDFFLFRLHSNYFR